MPRVWTGEAVLCLQLWLQTRHSGAFRAASRRTARNCTGAAEIHSTYFVFWLIVRHWKAVGDFHWVLVNSSWERENGQVLQNPGVPQRTTTFLFYFCFVFFLEPGSFVTTNERELLTPESHVSSIQELGFLVCPPMPSLCGGRTEISASCIVGRCSFALSTLRAISSS